MLHNKNEKPIMLKVLAQPSKHSRRKTSTIEIEKIFYFLEEDIGDPLTINKVSSFPDSIKWKEVMKEELDSTTKK